MQIFLDTGSVKEVKDAANLGVIDGVTTNPSLIAKEGKDFFQTIKQIAKLVNGPVSATYISPFVGRIDDMGQEGLDVVQEIRQIYDNYNYKTKILFASTRHPNHVKQAALIGADVCTMPYAVFQKLFHHPLTDTGLKKFLADWKKRKK